MPTPQAWRLHAAHSILKEREKPMTTQGADRPTTPAGKRLVGSILVALQQEGADVADLDWVDQVTEVEAQAAATPADAGASWITAEALALAMEADGWEFPGDPVLGAQSILARLPAAADESEAAPSELRPTRWLNQESGQPHADTYEYASQDAKAPSNAGEGLLDSDAFRDAVQAVFDAPGEWGPAQGYYRRHVVHFIDMLRARLASVGEGDAQEGSGS